MSIFAISQHTLRTRETVHPIPCTHLRRARVRKSRPREKRKPLTEQKKPEEDVWGVQHTRDEQRTPEEEERCEAGRRVETRRLLRGPLRFVEHHFKVEAEVLTVLRVPGFKLEGHRWKFAQFAALVDRVHAWDIARCGMETDAHIVFRMKSGEWMYCRFYAAYSGLSWGLDWAKWYIAGSLEELMRFAVDRRHHELLDRSRP